MKNRTKPIICSEKTRFFRLKFFSQSARGCKSMKHTPVEAERKVTPENVWKRRAIIG